MIGKGDIIDVLKSYVLNDVFVGKCDENGLMFCVFLVLGVWVLVNNIKVIVVEVVIGVVFLDGGYEVFSCVMRVLGLIFEG